MMPTAMSTFVDPQDFGTDADYATFPVPDYENQKKISARRRKAADDMVSQAQKNIDAGKNGRMVGPYWIANDDRGDHLQKAVGAGLGYMADREEQTQGQQLKEVRAELLRRMPGGTQPGIPAGNNPDEVGQQTPDRVNPSSPADLARWGIQASQVPGLDLPAKLAMTRGFSEPEKQTQPEGVREYQYAQLDGYKGSYQDWLAHKAKTTRAPEKTEASPQSVREYQFAQSQGFKGDYSTWLKDKTAATTRVHVAAPQRDRFQIVTDADGTQHRLNMDTLEKSPIGINKPAPLNEAQGNALLFGTRAQAAHQVLDEIGTDYSSMKTAIARAAENVPGANAGANAMLSGNEQRVIQAQRDFVNAILRKESGAAIAKSEFDNATKQYFPQVGDTKEVIAQKKANRELAIKGMKSIAGRGASGSFDEVPPAKPAAKRYRLKPGVRISVDGEHPFRFNVNTDFG